jgi:inorganic triphosphatase YgiF
VKEVELKLEVDGQAALDALARAAGGTPEKPVRQLNTFFDDAAGRLSRAEYALRLRDEDGTFLLTAKGPQKPASTAVSSRPEEEREIDAATIRSGHSLVVCGNISRLQAPALPSTLTPPARRRSIASA